MSSIQSYVPTKEKNRTLSGVLYLVATPIGNLSDLSERALKVLREVDFIAAEDTRNSMKLLAHFDIQKPLISYFEHNKRERGEVIAARLEAGESCALITDAGTPAISDPGEDLVALCAERGIPVSSIPGCCAAITALTLSALPTGRFCFEGFLPMNKAERRTRLEELKKEPRSMIFHEAPHKLKHTLDDFCTAFGASRRVALCRELTKLNEDVHRCTLEEAVAFYQSNEPRGEYVLVIEGAPLTDASSAAFWSDMTVPEHVAYYKEQGMERMDAIKATARDRGVPKNQIYREVVE